MEAHSPQRPGLLSGLSGDSSAAPWHRGTSGALCCTAKGKAGAQTCEREGVGKKSCSSLSETSLAAVQAGMPQSCYAQESANAVSFPAHLTSSLRLPIARVWWDVLLSKYRALNN